MFLDDVQTYYERDPAPKNRLETILCSPGLHAVWAHRVNHQLYQLGFVLLARLFSNAVRAWSGIEIHPGAKIGRGFFIDHGMGVVIGETCEIGNNVSIYQGVTLGGFGVGRGEKRHPTIGNNVSIGCNASVLGAITIGDDCRIGAGSVVLNDVPDHCTVVGVPGKIILKNGERVLIDDLKQMGDPLIDRLDQLQKQVEACEAALNIPQNSAKPAYGYEQWDYSI